MTAEMPVSRQVWRIDRAGSLDRLERRIEELSPPGPGQVQVAVRAIGLNFADIFACLGLYSATPRGGFVPGLEFAGVVERLGAPAPPTETQQGQAFQPGDRVMGFSRFGAYASHLNADRHYLRPVPEGWTFFDAAGHPVQALTAWYGLIALGNLKSGEMVLVHSAAGGVGLHALAIVKAQGARVVATVGQTAKQSFLMERAGLAADSIIVRDRHRFGNQLDRTLRTAGADGFDLVFDAVAGPFFRSAYDRLRPGGRLILYGAADMMPKGSRPNYLRLALKYLGRPRLDLLAMISGNKSVMGFNLIWLWEQVDQLTSMYDQLIRAIPHPPLVSRRFPFDEAPAALRCLQGGHTVGKVVLEVSG